MKRIVVLGVTVAVATASISWAAATDEQKCEAAKLSTASKYAACRSKVDKKFVLSATPQDYTKCIDKFNGKWSDTETKYGIECPTSGDTTEVNNDVTNFAKCAADQLNGESVGNCFRKLPATGQTTSYVAGDDGDAEVGGAKSYVDNADGTITDRNTGLMWEKKVKRDGTGDVANLHDADNCHPWGGSCAIGGAACGVDTDCGANAPCNAGDCQTSSPNGLTIFEWVAQLNTANFAGYDDWRVANTNELQTIVDYGDSTPPAINVAFNGASCGTGCTDITSAACACTQYDFHWSSTTVAANPTVAWIVDFNYGNVDDDDKTDNDYVRAVRGGS